MPAAIGAAVAIPLLGAEVAGATIVTGLTVSSLVGNVVIAGALIGGQLVYQSLQEGKDTNERQQATLNQSTAPRVRIYGRALVGGTRAFWDARNGQLFQLIMLANDRIEGIDEFWIGDRQVATSGGAAGGNVIDAPFNGRVFYEVRNGDDFQEASLTLRDYYPEAWTTAHRLNGIAYAVVVFQGVPREDFQNIYPQSYSTQLRFVVKGARIYDPTSAQDPENRATWAWNELSSACILDYLRHKDGARIKTSRIDLPSFADFQALCSEMVERKDDEPEARYRLWGTYNLNEMPKNVLPRMLATCDGQLVQLSSGKIGIRGGKWSPPVSMIGTDKIVTAELAQGNDKLDSYNRLNITYTDPDNYWQATEMQARDDLPSQASIGVLDQALDLAMVPSFTQGARVAKIAMGKANPIWTGTIGTHISALDAFGEASFDVEYDPIPSIGPIMEASCFPNSFTLRGDLSGCDIGFSSISPAIYDWDPELEEPPRPITPQAIAALSSPSELAAEGHTGKADVSWRNPNFAGFDGVRLWRSPTIEFADADFVADYSGSPGEMKNVTDDPLAAGTYRYWVAATNVSGISSSMVGPVSATVT